MSCRAPSRLGVVSFWNRIGPREGFRRMPGDATFGKDVPCVQGSHLKRSPGRKLKLASCDQVNQERDVG